jgi:hypothetical protein
MILRMALLGAVLFAPLVKSEPVTLAGINLDMSLKNRLSTLARDGFACTKRKTAPYQGYYECNKQKANIVFSQTEMFLNCAALGNCNQDLEELAQTVMSQNAIERMEPTVFYRSIGKVRWYCGRNEASASKVCVQQMVSIDREMVEIERLTNDPTVVDFMLSRRVPHIHVQKLLQLDT